MSSLVTWDSDFTKTIVLATSGGVTDAIVGHPLDSSKYVDVQSQK